MNQSYITCAEYQLFINHCQQNNIKIKFPSPWVNPHSFPKEIKLKEAYLFCLWLHQNYSANSNIYYRLPTTEEKVNYPLKNNQKLAQDGIRLVRFTISAQIPPLFHYFTIIH